MNESTSTLQHYAKYMGCDAPWWPKELTIREFTLGRPECFWAASAQDSIGIPHAAVVLIIRAALVEWLAMKGAAVTTNGTNWWHLGCTTGDYQFKKPSFDVALLRAYEMIKVPR